MARTITQIEDAIIADKNSRPELQPLTSPSQTARWRQWVAVFAGAVWAMEKLWDVFLQEVKDLIANGAYIGTLKWYAARAREFQFSAATSYYIDFDASNRPVYNVVNPADQIIKYAACTEGEFASVVVKAAKDSSGNPEPLTAVELTMFSDYIQTIKVAGTRISCISLPADALKIVANVYYDPIANPAIVQPAVIAAINHYLKALPFNGILWTEKIQDVIQKIDNVISVEMISVEVNYGNGNVPVVRFLQTLAGYARVHVAYPLTSTLNFVASNV